MKLSNLNFAFFCIQYVMFTLDSDFTLEPEMVVAFAYLPQKSLTVLVLINVCSYIYNGGKVSFFAHVNKFSTSFTI